MKEARYYLILCKKCGNNMKYMTYSEENTLSKKIKRCVYCGYSINVGKGLIKETKR